MNKVLVVDDFDINRAILREILEPLYEVVEAESGVRALSLMAAPGGMPGAILLDIEMPGMDGFEVLQVIKSNPRTENIPVLFITASDASVNETRGLQLGAADYISKPFNPDVVKARLYNQIQLTRYRMDLETMVEHKTAELIKTHERTLETLATIIEYRSLESGTHIRRSSDLTRIIIEEMLNEARFRSQLIENKYHSIIKAVALHDIGKVGIPDADLLKPGKLTPEEFELVKQHSVIGGKIIDSIALDADDDNMYLRHCRDICLYHHERWDGKGYPEGLREKAIPLSARILSIVDVYDALVNERCYKPAFIHEEAIRIIKDGAGTQFDPHIVAVLGRVSDKFVELERVQGHEA